MLPLLSYDAHFVLHAQDHAENIRVFTATSRRPNRATVLSTRARTSSSFRTSALMNSA